MFLNSQSIYIYISDFQFGSEYYIQFYNYKLQLEMIQQ